MSIEETIILIVESEPNNYELGTKIRNYYENNLRKKYATTEAKS